jgi:hypothetical protein
MKSKQILTVATFVIFLVFNSCSKEEQSVPGVTGTLEGTVTLYDEFGEAVIDKSGVTISIGGIFPPKSATTDIDGKYILENLPTGRYVIIFSKSGYGDYKFNDYAFVGGGGSQIRDCSITKKSTTFVTNLTLSELSGTAMTVNCTVSPEVPPDFFRGIRFFFGTSASVSSSNYITNSFDASATNLYSSSRTYDKTKFPTGTILYVKAYGESFRSTGYNDIITHQFIFSTLNPEGSNTASITVP